MNKMPAVVPLDESANIYMVLDESGRAIGTGTREVCEFLAQMSMTPAVGSGDFQQPARIRENVRSAIKI